MVWYWSLVVKIIPGPVIPGRPFKKENILNENVKSKRKVPRTSYCSPGTSREGEVIGRTVFIPPTWEPLIPVKSPEKQPILTASHRSVEAGKLQDMKILNHVLLRFVHRS